ncbi:MAG: SEC-C metal-binding domain-containing protein, partial [Kofleriaceae bacterium]
ESPMVTRSIEGAQKKVEGRNFDQRKNVLEYDDVMNQQRKTIYALRRQILEGRYHREPTDEEKKQGIEPEPVTSSGDWTMESLRPELAEPIGKLVDVLREKVKERDADEALGKAVGDTRPGWRILRAEIWRQYGVLLDLEKRYDQERKELIEYITDQVAASLIQQRERMYDLADARMASIIELALSSDIPDDEWDWDELEDTLQEQFQTEFDIQPGTADEVATAVWPVIEKRLGDREKELGRAMLMYFQRHFALEEIDQQWIEHLKTMDALREGIGLQGYGQKDPKKEYKKAGFSLFAEMMDRISTNTITKLFRVHIQKEEPIPQLEQKERQLIERGADNKTEDDTGEEAEQAAQARGTKKSARGRAAQQPGAEEAGRAEPMRRERPKVGRNDPCPCGSGKKYKKCHGKDEEAATTE